MFALTAGIPNCRVAIFWHILRLKNKVYQSDEFNIGPSLQIFLLQSSIEVPITKYIYSLPVESVWPIFINDQRTNTIFIFMTS